MHPSVPKKIDKYEVVGIVARGGMGVVYKALDRTLERSVAIKMVTGTGEEQRQGLKRFYREAQFTASLRHPNIVTVYDLGEFQGTPYLVMEYLAGRSLQSYLDDQSMTLADKVRCIRQVCEGLHYAHSRQPAIIHRDIKPANIMVLEDSTVKLIDFGIARLGQSRNTRTGFVMGTYQYMSPEQIKDKEIDGRSDIFSTGVVLFHLLTHRLPFEGENVASTLDLIMNSPAPPLHRLLRDYPRQLDAIMTRALAKRREERYQTADEFAFELMQVESELKRGSFGRYVGEAERLVRMGDYDRAKQELARVLEVDAHHREANDLMVKIQRALAMQHRQKRALNLRLHAEEALKQNRISEAFNSIEQALRLDSGNPELRAFREKILLQEKVNQALSRAERSLSAGRLEDAMRAIDEAIALDAESARAKSFKSMIEARLAEQKPLRAEAADSAPRPRKPKTTTSIRKRSSELKRIPVPEVTPKMDGPDYREPDPVWTDECFETLLAGNRWQPDPVPEPVHSKSVYSAPFKLKPIKVTAEQASSGGLERFEREMPPASPSFAKRQEQQEADPRRDKASTYGQNPEYETHRREDVSRKDAWSYESLQALEGSLALFVGPLAKVVIRKAALQARSSSDLLELVASSIKLRKDRQAFLEQNAAWTARLIADVQEPKKMAPPAAVGGIEKRPAALRSAEVDRATRLLAEYIGPLAGVLTKKASKEASSAQEFYVLLSKHVRSGPDRSRFLRDVGIKSGA